MKERDVKIMGDGSIGGGKYRNINILGSGRIVASVEAESIKIMGDCHLEDVKGKEIKVTGTAYLNGGVTGGTISVSGTATAKGDISNQAVTINGELKAKNISTEEFVSRGSFELENLNANQVSISLWGNCRAHEIGAEKVEVGRGGLWLKLYSFFHPYGYGCHLEVDTIEADRIYLEQTYAKSVRGNDVSIGPGCKISLVEFKDSVNIDKAAVVERTVQV